MSEQQFKVGDRVNFTHYQGDVLEYDGARYRVQLDGWSSWRWFLPTDLEHADDLDALQAENARLREALQALWDSKMDLDSDAIDIISKALGVNTPATPQPNAPPQDDNRCRCTPGRYVEGSIRCEICGLDVFEGKE